MPAPANSFAAEMPVTPPPIPPPASPIRDLVNTVERAIATVAPDTDRVVGAVRSAESGLKVSFFKIRTAFQSVSSFFWCF